MQGKLKNVSEETLVRMGIKQCVAQEMLKEMTFEITEERAETYGLRVGKRIISVYKKYIEIIE